MKKWILIGSAVVIVIIVVLLVFGISKIGPLIKTAVNTYGPTITKTDLRLNDVSVSLFSGEAKLKGFYLGNPKGFTSPQAMKAGSIYLNIDEKSLMKDPIVIDRIELSQFDVTYEKTAGTDNFLTIIDNIRKSSGTTDSSKAKSKDEKKDKKLLIRELTLKDGKVTLVVAPLGGKTVTASLPVIHLKNIGGEMEGVSPAKAAEAILTAIYGKVTSSAMTDILNDELKALGINMGDTAAGAKKRLETVGKGAGEEAGKLMDKAKGLFGK